MKTAPGAIYYDGLCIVCSTEINHYRGLPGAEKFEFIDITKPDFQPELHGIDPFLAHKKMHVRDTNGILHQGVDAFRAIWFEIPKYNFLYQLSKGYLARTLLEIGYKFFVVIRPHLPRKKSDCSESPYCEQKSSQASSKE
jgi:predicted DCC family thiol-disulfide oxidoreductase YuxK